jgi:hypothetical protein
MRTLTRRPTLFALVLLLSGALNGCSSLQPVTVHRGLKAVYPAQTVDLSQKAPVDVVVDSLTPTLSWEPLPTEYDRALNTPGQLARITSVTYQLRMSSLYTDWTYSRENLPENRHRLEEALAPNQVYAWTVRACFRLDGSPRCTEWGAWNENERAMVIHPNAMSFRLRAPGS